MSIIFQTGQSGESHSCVSTSEIRKHNWMSETSLKGGLHNLDYELYSEDYFMWTNFGNLAANRKKKLKLCFYWSIFNKWQVNGIVKKIFFKSIFAPWLTVTTSASTVPKTVAELYPESYFSGTY
jgi:hypothetical protein